MKLCDFYNIIVYIRAILVVSLVYVTTISSILFVLRAVEWNCFVAIITSNVYRLNLANGILV